MGPLRLGMLGAWHSHAAGVAREILSHREEFSLVGLWDPDPAVVAERRSSWSSTEPEIQAFGSAADLLAADLDGVVVEQRVYENVALAKLALEAGVPVLLEKPAGTSLSAHRELLAVARDRSVHLQMSYCLRYMSSTLEMLRRVRSGDLGQIYHFRARMPKAYDGYERFASDMKIYPGGIYFEMAGHMIDLMVAVLGRPTSVSSFMGHHRHNGGSLMADNGLGVFEYDNAWATVEAPALEILPDQRRIEVFGTEGAVVIPDLGSDIQQPDGTETTHVFRRGEPEWTSVKHPVALRHIADLREFSAVVREGKSPEYTLEHDGLVHELLLRSSRMADNDQPAIPMGSGPEALTVADERT